MSCKECVELGRHARGRWDCYVRQQTRSKSLFTRNPKHEKDLAKVLLRKFGESAAELTKHLVQHAKGLDH
jgi:hypothetical protein